MQNSTSFSWERYHQSPVIGILRGIQGNTVNNIAQTCLDTGFCTLEVTMNTEGATGLITALRRDFPGLNIGAGTVCNMTDLQLAIDAGAQFIVTPILDEEVVKTCVGMGIPVFPGAYTPTEIFRAWSCGASAVKVFPATQLGVSFIKDILAPLNQIRLLPTGGVSLQNIRSFFEAGVFGVGMGSAMLDKKLIDAGDFEGLKRHLLDIKAEIQDLLINE